MSTKSPPIDFRGIIRAELQRRGRGAQAALARSVDEEWQSLWRYLSGRQDASGERIAAYLAALELKVAVRQKKSVRKTS